MSERKNRSRPIGRQMMLSDQNNYTCLGTFLALTRMHGETHFVPRREPVEALVSNRIAMEIDFRTITCFDETIALPGNKTSDLAMAWNLMSLDVSALATGMVLKLSAHCIE